VSRICATIKRSAGNESVGEMWEETCAFEDTATLAEVVGWAARRKNLDSADQTVNVTLSRLQEANS
jgi:hypothetical protein